MHQYKVKKCESRKSFLVACNLKFKRVGCYADNNKKERPLRSYIMSDADIGTVSKKGKLPKGDKFNIELPKFACKCANEAINAGNAVFGLQNLGKQELRCHFICLVCLIVDSFNKN